MHPGISCEMILMTTTSVPANRCNLLTTTWQSTTNTLCLHVDGVAPGERPQADFTTSGPSHAALSMG